MDEVISSQEEMERLLKSFQVVGGGNTDFRPAFTYVNQLIKEGSIRHLDGLLYFTGYLALTVAATRGSRTLR